MIAERPQTGLSIIASMSDVMRFVFSAISVRLCSATTPFECPSLRLFRCNACAHHRGAHSSLPSPLEWMGLSVFGAGAGAGTALPPLSPSLSRTPRLSYLQAIAQFLYIANSLGQGRGQGRRCRRCRRHCRDCRSKSQAPGGTGAGVGAALVLSPAPSPHLFWSHTCVCTNGHTEGAFRHLGLSAGASAWVAKTPRSQTAPALVVWCHGHI